MTVREWKNKGITVPMCTARPGWQAMSLRVGKYKATMYNIHIEMVDILHVDTEHRIVRVEPLVSMGQLTSTLCPLGWMLPMVPELDDLTVGGMINGAGVETSSHIHGLFQNICISCDVVLPDGSLVHCSKEENSDLFYAIPWSHGTLGFVVAAELQIIPCKPFVKIEYIPLTTEDKFLSRLSEECTKSKPHDFVEALAFTKNSGVVMVADMVDSAEPDKLNAIGKFYKPWFFKHVESYLDNGEGGIEYIPIRDYYHRHTRSLFWELQDIIPFGNNIIFRHLFGWITPPKVSFLKLTQGEVIRNMYEKYHFIQDLLVPLKSLTNSLRFFDEVVKIYPIWLCPFKLINNPGMIHPEEAESEIYVDVGLYGNPGSSDFDAIKSTRKCEAFTRRMHGLQLLYADTYMTREEFQQMFDTSLYYKLRDKLHCNGALPDVYDKISKAARH